MAADGTTLDRKVFREEVARRFGVLPNFFCSAPAVDGLIDELWNLAKLAYLDSPLPALLKERLFVHLSRFCEVRYCIVRHSGFLMGLGRPAGDASAKPLTRQQVIRLLRRPVPDAATLNDVFQRLGTRFERSDLPQPETEDEALLFDVLTVIFLAPTRSVRAREAARKLVGDRDFELLTVLLAFVRTAHYWTEMHPELQYEADMIACMESHPELAALLLNTSEAAEASPTTQLRKALRDLDRAEVALHWNDAWLSAQKNAFQTAMNGAPLRDALGILIRAVVEHADGKPRCAFYIYDGGESPRHVVGMSDCHDGFETSPESPTCGLPVARGTPVIMTNVLEDPRWQPWTTREHGYRACWCFPVETASGTLVGSFSMSFSEPRKPGQRDLDLAADVTRTAAILISRHQESDERVRAEASEAKYRTLFESIEAGYCVVEVVFDEKGVPVDYVFREANPAFAQQTGLTDAIGKSVRAAVPGHEEFWFETYGRIALTGQPERFEHRTDALDRWYSVYAFRMGEPEQHRVAILFEDINERKLRELRQAFLLRFSDALRAQPDKDAVANFALQSLVEELSIDLCFLSTVSMAEDRADITYQFGFGDVPPLPGTLRISDGPGALQVALERTVVIHDATSDPDLTDIDRRTFAALRFGALVGVPIRKSERNIIWALGAVSAKPRQWSPAEVALIEEVAERTWAAIQRARARTALRASEQRIRQFAASSSAALWTRDAKTFAFEFVSPAVKAIYGVTPEEVIADPQLLSSLIIPEERDEVSRRVEQISRGEHIVQEYRIFRPTDRTFRWIRSTGFPLHDEQGRVGGIAAIASDITEARLAAEHQGILLSELQHRVRNIMAVIRSIASRTGERAQSVKEYASAMSGRLLTLARVQTLLTRAANVGVQMLTIVRDEITAHAQYEGQYEIAGPEVVISPRAAEILTLAVHELVTNALKYGALSTPAGQISIIWSIVERPGISWLVFDWTERGVRLPAAPPARRGFGTELIEGRIPYELGGRGKIAMTPDGVHCHLEFPLREASSILKTDAPRRATVFGGALDMRGQADLSGSTILVVEDDYYLASDTARALQGAGASVLGPCANEHAAQAEIVATTPTAAVVDINLGVGPSFAIAATLKARGIPFVFITGYDETVIPNEFSGVPRLQKPVELKQIVGSIADMLM